MDKICTSLEQSRQLRKLRVCMRTADMHYWEIDEEKTGKQSTDVFLGFDPTHYAPDTEDAYHYIPAWSLTALLDVLKNKITFGGNSPEGWFCCYTIKDPAKLVTIYGDSLVDACYKTILELHKSNRL